MELGLAYNDMLPANHRWALAEAAAILVDTTVQDLEASGDPDWSANSWFIGGLLSPGYRQRYTAGFARKFLYCLITVVWKLGQRERVPLSCVAEELAGYVIIQEAESLLDERGVKADFGPFEDTFFEDMDFALLYQGAYDGIEKTDIGDKMGIANLGFGDWFKRFGPPDGSDYPEVHPLAQDHNDDEQSAVGDL